jgi:hypothetical protein
MACVHGTFWPVGQLHTTAHTIDRSDRSDPDRLRSKQLACEVRFSETLFAAYKRTRAPAVFVTSSLWSRCPVSEAFFLCFSSTTQIGEALSAHTLHHRHHAVMLSIPSTTPPYLAGPGRRSRWCAIRVHLSKASPLATLDRIGSRGGDG